MEHFTFSKFGIMGDYKDYKMAQLQNRFAVMGFSTKESEKAVSALSTKEIFGHCTCKQ